jgi:hypothetical protein
METINKLETKLNTLNKEIELYNKSIEVANNYLQELNKAVLTLKYDDTIVPEDTKQFWNDNPKLILKAKINTNPIDTAINKHKKDIDKFKDKIKQKELEREEYQKTIKGLKMNSSIEECRKQIDLEVKQQTDELLKKIEDIKQQGEEKKKQCSSKIDTTIIEKAKQLLNDDNYDDDDDDDDEEEEQEIFTKEEQSEVESVQNFFTNKLNKAMSNKDNTDTSSSTTEFTIEKNPDVEEDNEPKTFNDYFKEDKPSNNNNNNNNDKNNLLTEYLFTVDKNKVISTISSVRQIFPSLYQTKDLYILGNEYVLPSLRKNNDKVLVKSIIEFMIRKIANKDNIININDNNEVKSFVTNTTTKFHTTIRNLLIKNSPKFTKNDYQKYTDRRNPTPEYLYNKQVIETTVEFIVRNSIKSLDDELTLINLENELRSKIDNYSTFLTNKLKK